MVCDNGGTGINRFPFTTYLNSGFVNAKNRYLMANIILSKESSNNELKCYFEAVLKLSQSDNQFPINLNDVWMLAYSEKCVAVRALKKNFIEGIDFIRNRPRKPLSL